MTWVNDVAISVSGLVAIHDRRTSMTDNPTSKRAGGRPSKPIAERRTERISFGVTRAQKAIFLVNAVEAGQTSNDYARAMLCEASLTSARSPNFELIDMLARIGADLARLRFIADDTGTMPPGLDAAIEHLNRKLDHLIVGSGIAGELDGHRAKLHEIAAKLETQNGMTKKARGMIATFDAIVTKVLSA
jgi:hypothetical protein